jgi:cell wall-associated NlpC family hydrolase
MTSTDTVLHIRVNAKSYADMIVLYRFNPQQVGMVNELMQDKYRQLFTRLIGSYTDITLSPQEIAVISQNLPPDLDEQRKNVVLAAYSLIGKVSYFWGGKSTVIGWDSRWGTLAKVTAEGSTTTGTVRPFGMDCSGYVAWVFANAAGNADAAEIIGAGTSSQYAACTPVNWSSTQPGDLAFYPDLSHVGIVVGKQNGNLLIANCNAEENNVAVSSVSGASSSGFYMIGRPKLYE